jgi:hypothetical protein
MAKKHTTDLFMVNNHLVDPGLKDMDLKFIDKNAGKFRTDKNKICGAIDSMLYNAHSVI